MLISSDRRTCHVESLKSVAVWGAFLKGEELMEELAAAGVAVRFFIDRNPPASGFLRDVPVYRVDQLIEGNDLSQVDAVFLALVRDRPLIHTWLREAGYRGWVFHYPNRYVHSIAKLFDLQGSPEDRALMCDLEQYVLAHPGPLGFYGAGSLADYLLSLSPALRSHVRVVADDSPRKRVQELRGVPVVGGDALHTYGLRTVFVSARRYESRRQIRRRLDGSSAEIVSLEDFVRAPGVALPERALFESDRPTAVYPEVEVTRGLDVLLLEPPGRLKNFVPTGLGAVHTILERAGIRFQTIDLNIIFYHRFHAARSLDGLDLVTTEDGYLMKEDPWATTHAGEWEKPAFFEHFRKQVDEVVERIVDAAPKIVGLSVSMTNTLFARAIARGIRVGLPGTTIVLGGHDCEYVEIGPRKYADYDYAVINEAEQSLVPLILAVLERKIAKDLPGVVSRYDTPGRKWIPALQCTDLDAYGFPTYGYTDVSVYRTHRSEFSTSIITGRGCKWSHCRFCAERFPWRGRSPLSVVEEIEWWLARGCSTFSLNDTHGNASHAALSAVCQEIIRRGLRVELGSQFRIDKRNSPEFFRLLRKAGFVHLTFGVDGWSDRLLRFQNKGYNMQLVERNLRDCHEAGIPIVVNLVLGVPGETEADVVEAARNIIRNKDHLSIQQITTLQLLVGSEYYEEPGKYHIRFRSDRDALLRNLSEIRVPSELWFSEEPYIDQAVRVARVRSMYDRLVAGGVNIQPFCENLVEETVANHSPLPSPSPAVEAASHACRPARPFSTRDVDAPADWSRP
jgi:radical SAM superfamily enzyme YgiQ (UPF0313 family)